MANKGVGREVFRGDEGVITENRSHRHNQPFYLVFRVVGGDALRQVVLMNEPGYPEKAVAHWERILDHSRQRVAECLKEGGELTLDGKPSLVGKLKPRLVGVLREKRLVVESGSGFKWVYNQNIPSNLHYRHRQIALLAPNLKRNLELKTDDNKPVIELVVNGEGNANFPMVKRCLAAYVDREYARLPEGVPKPFTSGDIINQQMVDLIRATEAERNSRFGGVLSLVDWARRRFRQT